jgi:hypothetical protein
MATLDHPAHYIGLLTVGSMVIDVAGNTLTARFLSNTGTVDDQFQIVKGSTCAPAPATGCEPATRGKLTIRKDTSPSRNRWAWKWKGGTIQPGDVGDPTDQTDLAVCVYDATGALLGGQIFHGAPEFEAIPRGFDYRDKLVSRFGLQKVRIKIGTPSIGAQIQVRGKGSGIGNPALPVATPLTAQLVNLDNGKCWASSFATTRTNRVDRVTAVLP